MRRLLTFMAIAGGAIALILLALWAMSGFTDSGLSTNGVIALGIGIVLTSGLGVGLMSLIFYSARQDDSAAAREPSHEPESAPGPSKNTTP